MCLEFRRVPGMSCELGSYHHLDQWSPTPSAAETDFMENIFFMGLGRGMAWGWFKHITFISIINCFVIYSEIIMKLTMMHNHWEPWVCFSANKGYFPWWRICLLMQETWMWSMSWEYPLEKEMAIHSSILAWEIPWTEDPGGLQSMGSQKSQTQLSD